MKHLLLLSLLGLITGLQAQAAPLAQKTNWLSYECSYDDAQSRASLTVDAATGRGTLTTVVGQADGEVNHAKVATSAEAFAKLCQGIQESGKNCADFQLYCITTPNDLHKPEACALNGFIVIDKKDPAHSILGGGNWAGEANCR